MSEVTSRRAALAECARALTELGAANQVIIGTVVDAERQRMFRAAYYVEADTSPPVIRQLAIATGNAAVTLTRVTTGEVDEALVGLSVYRGSDEQHECAALASLPAGILPAPRMGETPAAFTRTAYSFDAVLRNVAGFEPNV